MLATELIIEKLKDISGFKSCIIVGQDGLSLDSFISDNEDKNFLSAIVSSMYNEINKQSNRFSKKDPEISIMETDQAVLAISKMPIDTETYIIFNQFEQDSDSISIMESLKQLNLSYVR